MKLDKSKSYLGFDCKSGIDDVLGEEMKNYCLENPDKAIAFSWLFSLSLAEFNKAHEINSSISDYLLKTQEILGEELCVWYANNYQGLCDILILLSGYSNAFNNAKKFRAKLKQLILLIHLNNYNAKIIPLIRSFGTQESVERLLSIMKKAKINFVQDLNHLLVQTIVEQDKVLLVRFIESFREDKNKILCDELNNLAKKDRDKEIIRKRAEGATLEKASTGYAITHEGVRQIEKKYQSRFNRYVEGKKPQYILYAFSRSNCSFISVEDIKEQLRDLADIFVYCLKKSSCPTAKWSEELNGFIVGDDNWYKKLKDYKESLPEILDCELLDEMIADTIRNFELPITFKDTKRLVLTNYNLSGKVYLKGRTSLSQLYMAVLKKFYPKGIKLYDDREIVRFRNYVRELFGNVYLPENNRAIEVRLTEITILCDRGKRILASAVKIPSDLLRRIHDMIFKFDRQEIMFSTLFEKFKDELLKNSNVTNKYFLQGVLKLRYSNEFIFTRYTVKKEITCLLSQAK